jgi:hypothetical protein
LIQQKIEVPGRGSTCHEDGARMILYLVSRVGVAVFAATSMRELNLGIFEAAG